MVGVLLSPCGSHVCHGDTAVIDGRFVQTRPVPSQAPGHEQKDPEELDVTRKQFLTSADVCVRLCLGDLCVGVCRSVCVRLCLWVCVCACPLPADGGVVVVPTPATLEGLQTVSAGSQGRALLTLGYRVDTGTQDKEGKRQR